MVICFQTNGDLFQSQRPVLNSDELRDFQSEMTEILNTKDPEFKPNFTSVWGEHAKTKKIEDSALEQANNRLEALSADSRKAAYEHDTLLLAKDLATIGKLFGISEKSARAERLKKITHMREQNTMGANIVESFMERNAVLKCGTEPDILSIVEQVGGMPSQNPFLST